MSVIIIHDFYGGETIKISSMISQLSKLLDKLDGSDGLYSQALHLCIS